MRRAEPIYSWTIVDHIFDTYRARGVRPYVEIGFMPEALSIRPQPYQHDFRPGSGSLRTGWAYPPKDYAKWEELIYQWVRPCVEGAMGAREVATWYFQTWNEANLERFYWGGGRDAFFKLHDSAVRAVRRALPRKPESADRTLPARTTTYLTAFMNHVKEAGTPTDFLSPSTPKGSPMFVDDGGGKGACIRMGIATHLAVADRQFAQIEADPHFRATPIIIGESDPEGCAACRGSGQARTATARCTRATPPRSFSRLRRLLRVGGVLQPRGHPHLGVRVRGPALLRRLSSADVGGRSICHVMNVFQDVFEAVGGESSPRRPTIRSRSTR